MTTTSATVLPDQHDSQLLIKKFIEFSPFDKRVDKPRAQFLLAKTRQENLSHQERSNYCERLLMQLLLFDRVTSETSWELRHLESGAPYLLDDGKPSKLSVSLAHSANWLAAGVAWKAQIGVDVEKFRARKDFTKIASYLGWDQKPATIRDFHSKWTLWEAAAKCAGGDMMMEQNTGFEQLCNVILDKKVCNLKGWNALHDNVNEESFYAVVLKCESKSRFFHRTHELGAIKP